MLASFAEMSNGERRMKSTVNATPNSALGISTSALPSGIEGRRHVAVHELAGDALEGALDFREGELQAGLDGAHGNAGGGGNLELAHALEERQIDGLALAFRQAL